MVIGYWVMLLTMLYESVIFASIILGLTCGHFLVGLLTLPPDNPPLTSLNTPLNDPTGSTAMAEAERVKGDCC